MVNKNKVHQHKHIRDPKFGIEYDLFYELSNNYDQHSSFVNKNIERFTENLNPQRSHVNQDYVICSDNNQKDEIKKIFKSTANGKPPQEFYAGSIYRALWFAFHSGVGRVKTQGELETIKDVSIVYGKNDNDNLKQFSEKENIPFLSLDDIVGLTNSDKEEEIGKNGYFHTYSAKPILDDKRVPLEYFFSYLRFRSNFLYIYDNYIFVTRSERKGDHFLATSKKNKKFNEKEFKTLSLRLSFWIDWMKNSQVKKFKIISAAPFGMKMIESYKYDYSEQLKKRMKIIQDEVEVGEKKLNSLKNLLIEREDEIESQKQEIDRLKNNIEEMRTRPSEEEFDVTEDNFIQDHIAYSEILKKINHEKDELKKLNIQLDDDLENGDSQEVGITEDRVKSKKKEITQFVSVRNSILTDYFKDFESKYIRLEEEKVSIENDISAINDKLLELKHEKDSLDLIYTNMDNIHIITNEEKRRLEKYQNRNLHDRVYCNDHTLISWGKGFDIIQDPIKFSQKQVKLKMKSTLTAISLFNPDNRPKTEYESVAMYSTFDKIVEEIVSV